MEDFLRLTLGENEFEHQKPNVISRTVDVGEIDFHWHEFYELELIMSGSGTVSVNSITYPFCKGSLLLTTPTDIHSYKITEPLNLVNISFEPHSIDSPMLLDNLLTLPFCAVQLSEEQFEWISAMVQKLSNEANKKRFFDRQYIVCMLSCLLIEIIRSKPAAPVENKQLPESVRNAMRFMQLHFRESLTLEQVACTLSIKPAYLSELFCRSMPYSFKEYLLSLKLEYAATLLRCSQNSSTDISFYAGFNSVSYFTKAFVKHYHQTPIQYRKNYSQ